jgi:predicted transcriptional regulator
MELRDWLAEHGVTHHAAAAMIGCTQPYVTLLAAGRRRPSLPMLQRIVQVTEGEVGLEDFVDGE